MSNQLTIPTPELIAKLRQQIEFYESIMKDDKELIPDFKERLDGYKSTLFKLEAIVFLQDLKARHPENPWLVLEINRLLALSGKGK